MSDSKIVLENLLNRRLSIIVKGDKMIKGTLKGFDNHLNVLLTDAEEIKDKTESRKLGTIIIRGDSITYIQEAE
ncbi:LSM domain-containing protein [Sulfolobus sp. E11-6]|uniref:LSM domain-containing protein n=1 Tax=Sulfolobus sp. E11-6 TaxID=2663020 RepID=UPI001297F12D|nr:LSM domain-containing protein [Sulfolobus sp. E11-6]QGA69043.1 small nuclear ribonucleoprotein [Sulfolobus sp. E11-6]